MTDVLLAALAFLVGLLVGLAVGAARAFALTARRRAMVGASAGFARFGLETLPTRSAADILAGRIRVVLAGVEYELPVLPRHASRAWLASLDERFASIADELEQARDDAPRILTMLAAQSAGLLEMLRRYDASEVLPEPAYLDEFATDSEILVAIVEVWRAANPLAATLAEAADATMDSTPFARPSISPTPTAGDLGTSTG